MRAPIANAALAFIRLAVNFRVDDEIPFVTRFVRAKVSKGLYVEKTYSLKLSAWQRPPMQIAAVPTESISQLQCFSVALHAVVTNSSSVREAQMRETKLLRKYETMSK